METKKCKTCGLDKDIEEFPYHHKKLGTRMAHCDECYSIIRKNRRIENIESYRIINKNSYDKNKKSRIDKVNEYQKNNKNKVRVWSNTYRIKKQDEWIKWKSTLSCSKCSENHPSCLEFHHINPNEKEGLISKMKFRSKELLEAELKKCIVLCSNCHRKHHFNENNNFVTNLNE